MGDVHSKEIRSYNMSRIRSKDTKPEMLVRKYLFSKGLRYRIHVKALPGKPDIVLLRYKTAIFIQGCFWHGHQGCKYYVIPKTRSEWWLNKIQTNSRNDLKSSNLLTQAGWKVLEIWECDLKGNKLPLTLENLFLQLTKINSI